MSDQLLQYIMRHPNTSLEELRTMFGETDTDDDILTAYRQSWNTPSTPIGYGSGMGGLFFEQAKFDQQLQEMSNLQLPKLKQNTFSRVKDAFANAKEIGGLGAQIDLATSAYNAALPFAKVAIGAGTYAAKGINDLVTQDQINPILSMDMINSEIAGGYTGTMGNLQQPTKANMFTIGKANKQIAENNALMSQLGSIGNKASDMRAASEGMNASFNGLKREFQMAGNDQRAIFLSKEGGELQAPWTPEITIDVETFKTGGTVNAEWKPTIDVEEFRKGGDLNTGTKQMNVIPEGSLHKEKHHLKDIGFDDKHITKKGIPVVDNNGNQQAEIELNEIIFTLEVTKKLEEGYKEYYEEGTTPKKKEDLALKAGKLLWKEILYNTDDRTGLIDTLKEGGVLKAQEGATVTPKEESTEDRLARLKAIALEQNPNFIQRLVNLDLRSIDFTDDEGRPARGTHYLVTGDGYAWPRIQDTNGELKWYTDENAVNRVFDPNVKDYIEFADDEDAQFFGEHYKEMFPEFFDNFKKKKRKK